MKLFKKILIGTGVTVLVAALACGATVYGLWHNEISGILSIRKLVDGKKENASGPVYEIEVPGDYYFDDFLAQGGAKNDQELIDFLVKNLTKGIIPITLNAPSIGCSSFTFQDEDGDRYFARNYDFSTTTSMIVHTAPGNGRHASISSADLQFLGITGGREIDSFMDRALALVSTYVPLDGINDAGVSCGIYMSYQKDDGVVSSTDQNTDKPDLTSTTMLRMILDYADDVDEAVELVKQYDFHDSANTSFHYMVADASGKSAILEWVQPEGHVDDDDGTKRELRVYYNDDDNALGTMEGEDDFQYITNFLVTPGYYDSDDQKGGYDRYREIPETIDPTGSNGKGLFSKEEGLSLLKTLGRRSWDADKESDGNGITVWSSLYNLTDRTMTWVSNEEFDIEGSVFEYSL